MQAQLDQLEQEGYTVFKAFLPQETTARIRAHMDSLMPPRPAPDDTETKRLQTLRHPIPGEIMAEILARPELLNLAKSLLKSGDLRLLEQVLLRTDGPSPKTGASGWHVDMAFKPEHYSATPRQTYFHMVHCLNTVPEGGGAFTVIPGSHHKTFAAAAKLESEEELPGLQQDIVEKAGINLDEAIEVLPEDGDLLVFNPMCLHSASHNKTSTSRYVYFASFFDPSASYLAGRLKAMNYRDKFPDSLRDNLPAELQPMLGW